MLGMRPVRIVVNNPSYGSAMFQEFALSWGMACLWSDGGKWAGAVQAKTVLRLECPG